MDLRPQFMSEIFLCPHCQVASQQQWFDADISSKVANTIINNVFYDYRKHIKDYQQGAIADFILKVEVSNIRHMREFVPNGFSVATCSTCKDISLWVNEEIVYPKKRRLPRLM